MAAGANERSLDDALGHPLREDIMRLLWHLGEPATATELRDQLPDDATLAEVSYHCTVLENAGVIEVDADDDPTRRPYVVGGSNAADAVRRLDLRK